MFDSLNSSQQEFLKEHIRYNLPGIAAQSIRNDIARAGYMKSDGSNTSPGANFDAIKNIPKEVSAVSGVQEGKVTFYAFLVQRITELKQKKLNDPLFDKYSYLFTELLYPPLVFNAGDKITSGNIHLIRSLLFKYQDNDDNQNFSIKNEIPVADIKNPGSDEPKLVQYGDGAAQKGGAFDTLLKRLINKLVAKEAADRVDDLSSGSIQQPDPFYYEQARKVLNGGNASYQGPSSDGGADFSLTNLAGYQNIQYIGAGLGVLAFTLIGGTVLAKIRD